MDKEGWRGTPTGGGDGSVSLRESLGCACLRTGSTQGCRLMTAELDMESASCKITRWKSRERETTEGLRQYTAINLRWLCAYGPKLLPFEVRDSIFSQGQSESRKTREADGHAAEETEANGDGCGHGSERRGFKCSKHLVSLQQCTRKAGFMWTSCVT